MVGDNQIVCPACAAPETVLRWQASSSKAAQHFVLREADYERHERLRRHIEALWRGVTCDIRKCGACGFGFAWPFVAGDAEFYELAYGSTSYPSRRWEFDRTMLSLRRLPLAGARALEIGAGTGSFLDMLTPEMIPRSAVVAAEYNEGARRTLTAKGYRAAGADIRSPSFEGGPFDLVFLFQVLEHMDGLDAVFAKIREITAPSANIFIAVPNPVRIHFNEDHRAMRDMPPVHIGKWTSAAFEAVVTPHGFSIVEMALEPCSLAALALQDSISRYLQWAQEPGSLANRVRRRPRNRARRFAEFALIAGLAPARLRAWGTATRSLGELGESIWVHLRKGVDSSAESHPSPRCAHETTVAPAAS